MPSEAPLLATQTEKPHHYTYLKEFRTQQCPLFLQHKCTQHRPFTCFHWHFMNQRRRRPVRRRDGTFNYNPDVYCTKYDETTGLCPDGDECQYLHRTAGDTERRYHLRYYKTCTCVHETDARGHCVKNGPHCAFAHGAHDLRPPVYDVREVQSGSEGGGDQAGCGMGESPLGSSLEKDRIINEDPRWNDTNYVLANYKTDPCKRPPRLCRQGYACPSYHNSRDKRRSPKTHKYRSTPCPHVKHGDDWGDPSQCDNGDNCPYCHTRTEQQFHPEIYKSTKCNDMVQTGYCPRGPFCAFAHVEMEMTTQRDLGTPTENSLAAFFPNALLPSSVGSSGGGHKLDPGHLSNGSDRQDKTNGNGLHLVMNTNGSIFFQQPHNPVTTAMGEAPSSSPGPIGRGRTSSLTSSMTSSLTSLGLIDHPYQKAPGSEREDGATKLRLQIQAIDNDVNLDLVERSKRKQNLLLLHNLSIGSPLGAAYMGTVGSSPTTPSSTVSSLMSPHAQSFYPPGDTVESVIAFKRLTLAQTATTDCDTCASGNALDEDLNLGDLNLSTIDREFSRDNDDTNSVCSSLSAGFTSSSGGAYLGATSVPVTIPSGGYQRGRVSSISQSPPSASPLGNLTAPGFFPATDTSLQQQKQELQLQEAAAAFLSQPNPGKYSAPGYSTDFNSMSPSSNPGLPASPLIGAATYSAGSMNGYELQRVRDELVANKMKLSQWEDGIAQARSACDAWKREAEESARKAKKAEEEKLQAISQRDEALAQLAKLQQETQRLHEGSFSVMPPNVIQTVESMSHVKQLQTQLSSEIDPNDHTTNSATMAQLAQMLCQSPAMKCMVCREMNRSVAVGPCNHYVLCDVCAAKATDCPYCHVHISQRSNIVLPL